MKKGLLAAFFLLLTLLLATGIYRLRIGVDIFDLLPSDSLIARGLRLYQNSFGTSHELILAVQAPDADTAEKAARALAETIEVSRLSSRVLWQNPFIDNPDARAELLAYFWYNQPPPQLQALADRLQGERLERWLQETKEQLAYTYQPDEIARMGYDPLALSRFPSETALSSLGADENPFTAEKGKFRILMVAPPFESAGFWTLRRWTRQVQMAVDAWRAQEPQMRSVAVRVTGTPAFIAQTGSGLLADMQKAAVGTLLFVSGLFWLVHRQFRPLIWLAALLVFILSATIALGGLFMGEVHAVSLGFAAILLGLAADYGLILFQEFRADPGRPAKDLRAAVAPSIFWAAVTTAAAFLIIGRSSLPGMRQLGLLVGNGIFVAAVVMTFLFLRPRAVKINKKTAPPQRPSRLPGPRTAIAVTVGAALLSLGLLFFALPAVDYSTDNLGPKRNPVRETLEEVQRRIGGYDQSLWMIVSGALPGEVGTTLRDSGRLLDDAVEAGLLESYLLPVLIWPHPDDQRENREVVEQLVDRYPQIRKAVLAAGFSEASLKLDQQVFAHWRRFVQQDIPVIPQQPASRWVFRQFAAEEAGMELALGRLRAAPDASTAQLLKLAENMHAETGSYVFSWSLLSESLLGVIKRDATRILLPIGIVVPILLAVAFRKIGEILLSLGTIGFSLLCLLAIMAAMDWSWNLMNVMALPLLFGAGVDYSIHIQFALRRHDGRLSPVRRTVGKAILLCGISTASGFGSLALASNVGVASLGRVCAVGILIICLSSVFLLPGWWRGVRRPAA